MTTQYAEEQGFKKKYLAPLIVLMLCAVSLTGAAYAYSTSVTGHGTIEGDYYSIDLYTDADGKSVLTKSLSSTDDFDVQTKKTIAPNGETTADYNYYASVDAAEITFTTHVKVASNNNNEDCLIYGFAKYTPGDKSAAMYKTWTTASVTCKVFVKETTGDETAWKEVTSSDATTPVSFSGKTGVTYDVKITVAFDAIDWQDLGTSVPGEVEKAVSFDGTDCIEITLNATEA